jgi:hypothetical protein
MRFYYNVQKALFLLLFSYSLYSESLNSQKIVGFEFNPFYLVILNPGENNETYYSGTVSLFDHMHDAEIAIPFSYRKDAGDDYKEYTLDLHYRKFLNDYVGGLYLSGFVRYAKMEGYLSGGEYGKDNFAKQSKIGLGVGIGYRYFDPIGLYWGCSLGLGHFLNSEDSQKFDTDMIINAGANDYIFDVEFLKFGYAF